MSLTTFRRTVGYKALAIAYFFFKSAKSYQIRRRQSTNNMSAFFDPPPIDTLFAKHYLRQTDRMSMKGSPHLLPLSSLKYPPVIPTPISIDTPYHESLLMDWTDGH